MIDLSTWFGLAKVCGDRRPTHILGLAGSAGGCWKACTRRMSDHLSPVMNCNEYCGAGYDDRMLIDRSAPFLRWNRHHWRDIVLNPSFQVLKSWANWGWKYKMFGTLDRIVLFESEFLLFLVCITTMKHMRNVYFNWNGLWVRNRWGRQIFIFSLYGLGWRGLQCSDPTGAYHLLHVIFWRIEYSHDI